MSDLITTALLNLQKDTETVTSRVIAGSAFQSVTNQGSIGLNGKIVRALKNPVGPFHVPEGGKKSVITPEFINTIIAPSKKAFVYVTTMEADIAAPEVARLFANAAPGVFAQEFDHNLAGIVTDTNAGGIKALTLSTPTSSVEVVDAAGLKAAFGALSATGGLPTAWVLSSALYGDLVALDATESDRKFSNELVTAGTLLGLPVRKFRSVEKVGFIRDFSSDEWAMLDNDLMVRTLEAGTITDSQGVTHDLGLENKTAYILEGFYSYYADPENSTVALTAPPVTP